MYKENTLDYSNVRRWVCRLNDEKMGTASVADVPRSDCPSSSVNPVNKANSDTLIIEDRRTALYELTENLGVSHGSAYNIVGSLGLLKACACWVCLFVGWLLNVPATCECISGTDLHRQFFVLPH